MSDTPRTDEVLKRISGESSAYQCGALTETCRQLERELREEQERRTKKPPSSATPERP